MSVRIIFNLILLQNKTIIIKIKLKNVLTVDIFILKYDFDYKMEQNVIVDGIKFNILFEQPI